MAGFQFPELKSFTSFELSHVCSDSSVPEDNAIFWLSPSGLKKLGRFEYALFKKSSADSILENTSSAGIKSLGARSKKSFLQELVVIAITVTYNNVNNIYFFIFY
ncbi:hypothetical protein D3C79_735260 [compost metagenome]